MLRSHFILTCFACTILANQNHAAAQVDERWGCEADLQYTGKAKADHLGFAVDSGGDWNGDGKADVLVGGGVEGASGLGEVRLYAGSGCPGNPCNVPFEPPRTKLIFNNIDVHAGAFQWGTAFALVGDLNDGGLDDIVIGDPFFSNQNGDQEVGRVFVFYGESHTTTPVNTVLNPVNDADVIIEGTVEYGWFGFSLDGLDVTPLDDENDLVVGAPGNVENSGLSPLPSGNVYVLEGSLIASAGGSATTLSLGAVSYSAGIAGDRFGWDVARVGDLGNNGIDEFIAGAPQIDLSNSFVNVLTTCSGCTGFAKVHSYPATTAVFTFSESAPTSGELSGYGTSVAGIPTVNGNNFADVVIGAPYFGAYDTSSSAPLRTGAVYVYDGRNGVGLFGGAIFPEDPSAAGEPDPAWSGSMLGWSVAGLGDTDGDSKGEFAAGAPRFKELPGAMATPCGTIGMNGDLLGRVNVYDGSNGSTLLARYRGELGGGKPRMGWSLAAGDIDGDGADDILTGHVGYSPPSSPNADEEGRAFVFFNDPCCP